jgi:uncharacterized membrane protein YdjX (TVP38/TMEM64 family)
LKKTILIVFIACLAGSLIAGLAYIWAHWSECCVFLGSLGVQGNIERLRLYILSFGMWAPVISALLMIAQSVILFLPAFPIFVVNALVFGWVWGMLLSWGSAVMGSMVCFLIAKNLGRPVVQKLVNREHLNTADAALKRYEKYVIPLFGCIPAISFDIISYAAGLTLLTFWEFLPLVCIAQIPSAFLYSYCVDKIDRGTLDIYWLVAFLLFLFLGLTSIIFRAYLTRRHRRGVISPTHL